MDMDVNHKCVAPQEDLSAGNKMDLDLDLEHQSLPNLYAKFIQQPHVRELWSKFLLSNGATVKDDESVRPKSSTANDNVHAPPHDSEDIAIKKEEPVEIKIENNSLSDYEYSDESHQFPSSPLGLDDSEYVLVDEDDSSSEDSTSSVSDCEEETNINPKVQIHTQLKATVGVKVQYDLRKYSVDSLPNPYVLLPPQLILTPSHLENLRSPPKSTTKKRKKRPNGSGYRPKKKGYHRKFYKYKRLTPVIEGSSTGRRPYKCSWEDCSFITKRRNRFFEHFRKHTGETPFTCEKCGKSFRSKALLDSHLKRHENENYLQCPVCEKSFKFQREFDGHVKKMHKDKRRMCPICNQIYASDAGLELHTKAVHEKVLDCVCELCGASFFNKSRLSSHLKVHERDPNFKGRGNRIPWNSSIAPPQPPSIQVEDVKPDPQKMFVTPPSFPCKKSDDCDKIFSTAVLLQRHIYVHHLTEEEKMTKCPICGRVFKNIYLLKSHANSVHVEERPFKCSICGQAFKCRNHLTRHEKGHSKPNWKPRANCKPKVYSHDTNAVPESSASDDDMGSSDASSKKEGE